MDLLTADEAARYLGIKRTTLYAYVSRGLLQSVSDDGDLRRRRYLRSDLDRLKRRSDAHSGHGAAAAGAFDWGPPSLETRLTDIRADGPAYRGRPVAELTEQGASFEQVAEWLWTGAFPEEPPDWTDDTAVAIELPDTLPGTAGPIDILRVATALAGVEDAARFCVSAEARLALGRRLVTRLVRTLAARSGAHPGPGRTVAELAARLWGRAPTPALVRAIDTALVVVADHELNASTFSARVTASTGADLYACVGAALATFSGPLHGGACDRCEALLSEVDRADSVRTVLRSRLQRGETPPGFGHRLYPEGDPRFPLLVGAAGRTDGAGALAKELVAAAAEAGLGAPTSDMGLVLLARDLRLPPEAGGTLFALGRLAGWIAHAEEQRTQGFLLRPRARYVGR